MDDAAVGRAQARGLHRALEEAGIGVGALWLHCFRLGGEVGEVEIEAYLHHAFQLPACERDLLAHAANELIDHGPGRRAPYASDLAQEEHGGGVDGDGGTGAGESAQR